jgi:hypothetical protein
MNGLYFQDLREIVELRVFPSHGTLFLKNIILDMGVLHLPSG